MVIFAKKSVFSRKFTIRAFAIVGLYVAIISYIFQNEDRFFFNHDPITPTISFSFEVVFNEVDIKINNDIQLHGLHFLHHKPKGIVLFFPDGDYCPLDFKPQENLYYKAGYNVIIPDYRGTGKSNSSYQSEGEIYKDAQQWYKLSQRIADSLNLIVYGKDFGAGIAAYIGGEFKADIILLENPYFSWSEVMLKKYFWWTPHTYLTKFEIPTWEFIRKSTNKTILIHAAEAEFIPYENSSRLLEYLKPGDELITIEAESMDLETQQRITDILNQ